jgi:hypothetical protein
LIVMRYSFVLLLLLLMVYYTHKQYTYYHKNLFGYLLVYKQNH